MKALALLALTGSIVVLAACGDDGNGTGAGGYTPGVISQVSAGPGGTKVSSGDTSGQTTGGETSSTQSSSASSSSMSSSSTGMMLNEPLLPYCGCITDNLGGVGLCTNCWDMAVAKGGGCEMVLQGCGTACQNMLDALATECQTQATPGCLQTIAEMAPNQVDDFAAVLQCLCACASCDNEACM